MRKIVFVIPTLSNGGAERVVSILSTALADANNNVSVIKYYDCDDEYSVGANVDIYNLSRGGRNEYLKMGVFKRVLALRKLVDEIEPDYIVPFMFSVAQLTALACMGKRVVQVQSIRINPAIGPASKIKRFIRDYFVYRSKFSFVQNESQRAYFKKTYWSKIHILFNPVNVELFDTPRKEEDASFIFCSSGRLEKQKDFELLIRAFSQVFREKMRYKLNIYGEGSLKNSLQNLINELGMGSQITLMGRTNDIKNALSNSDCFVLSSRFEGMPNALIEAMACGVPCVSTNCPTGPSDLIEDGVNGFLVNVADEADMSANLKKISCLNRVELNSIGMLGQNVIKSKCSDKTIARKFIEICEKYEEGN